MQFTYGTILALIGAGVVAGFMSGLLDIGLDTFCAHFCCRIENVD